MSATQPINTPEREGAIVSLPVAAATMLYAGTLVAIDASGNAVPAADTAGLKVLGRCEEDVVNAGLAGAKSVRVKRGVFRFANSATSAVDADDVGLPCYVEDDSTVAETGDNSIVAGIVIEVGSEGVWIDTRFHLHVAAAPANSSITAAMLANAVADQILGAPGVTVANSGVPDGVATVTIQARDGQGNALAARCLVRVWFDDGAYGAPTDLGTLAATTGTILKEDTDDALATVVTDANGVAVLTLDTAADGTVHAMAAIVGLVATGNAAITGN
jgi:hypothetical protein